MYPTYLQKYNVLVDDNSPLYISQSVNIAGGNIVVQADIEVTGDITTTNNKILYLTSHSYSDEYFCTVGYYNEATFSLTDTGQTQSYEHIIPINPDWNLESTKVIVMVQSWSNKHIFQAKASTISLENLLMLNTNLNSIYNDSDNDGVLNPGENAIIDFSIENVSLVLPANDISVTISTSDEIELSVSELELTDNLDINENVSFSVMLEISDQIELGDKIINVLVRADYIDTYDDYYEYEVNFPININISLNQQNWPIINGSQIVSSPAIIDIDSDDQKEVIFGDYGGLIHVLDSNGNPKEGFPFQTGDDIWGSAAVGDIDNDGEKEIVIGSKDKKLYILNNNGELELSYSANQFLMSTPVICELDGDPDKEIVFSGYTSSGDVFAINHDGSNVNGFPVSLNEKILKGAAVTDLNDNGLDDIIVATETQNLLCIIWDNGDIDTLFTAQDKFKSSPTIVKTTFGENFIFVTSNDHNLYAFDTDGNMKFIYVTLYEITASPAVVDIDPSTIGIFFGSQDGYLYGVDQEGNDLSGWPIQVGGQFTKSPVIADLDSDGLPEIISGNTFGNLYAYSIDGTLIEYFPIDFNAEVSSTPAIIDIDNDGDLEIFCGITNTLAGIDYKIEGDLENYWNVYRGNYSRNGTYNSTYIGSCGSPLKGDLNCDANINITDIILLIDLILDNTIAAYYEMWSGDVNDDENINIYDVILLVNTILEEL